MVLFLYNKNVGNCSNFNSAKIDITVIEDIKKIFRSFKPDILIHTAAITSPLLTSQIDSRLVYNTNVNATENLGRLCAESNTRLIYISTDLVYAGYRGSMLDENAKLMPLSLYAETKLMGEVKIREVSDNYIILRVALMYGKGLNKSYNHFHRMYQSLISGTPVILFTDQFRTPVELSDTAEIINGLIKMDISNEIINLGGKERVSRYELGEILCYIAGLDKTLLNPVKMDWIPDLPQVEDVSMNTGKLRSYGISQMSIADSIKNFIRNYDSFA